MGGNDQQPSRLFYELCALIFALVRYPHLFFPSVGALSDKPQRSELSPACLASLFLGASLALMLCGSITFVLGCILMPWVIGFVILFYFFWIVAGISGIGKAILFPRRTHSCEEGDKGGPRPSFLGNES